MPGQFAVLHKPLPRSASTSWMGLHLVVRANAVLSCLPESICLDTNGWTRLLLLHALCTAFLKSVGTCRVIGAVVGLLLIIAPAWQISAKLKTKRDARAVEKAEHERTRRLRSTTLRSDRSQRITQQVVRPQGSTNQDGGQPRMSQTVLSPAFGSE